LGVGYDKQIGSMLLGVMADYQFRTNKTTIGGVSVKESDAIFLGARAGFLPTHNMLVYVLGGYTWLNHSGVVNSLQSADTNYGDAGYTAKYGDGSFGGFTLGGGAEIPVARNWFLGVEGRHTWYGKEDLVSSTYTYTSPTAYHQDKYHVTDEPTEWYVGATLKLKMGGDSFK
jgi:opacity protein-like surface antigen